MIKRVVGRKFTVLSQTEWDVVRFEYVEIVNSSRILNGIYEIDDVWNQPDDETGPDKNAENFIEFLSLMMMEGWWYQGSHQINRT